MAAKVFVVDDGIKNLGLTWDEDREVLLSWFNESDETLYTSSTEVEWVKVGEVTDPCYPIKERLAQMFSNHLESGIMTFTSDDGSILVVDERVEGKTVIYHIYYEKSFIIEKCYPQKGFNVTHRDKRDVLESLLIAKFYN